MKVAATEPNLITFGPAHQITLGDHHDQASESHHETEQNALDTIPLPEVFGHGIKNIEDVNFICDTKDPSRYAMTEKCEDDAEQGDLEEQ